MNEENKEIPLELYIRNIFHFIRYSAEQETEALNITSQQGRLLEIIVDGLELGKDINRKYLEKTMAIKGSSVTSLLNGLEKKEFIRRNVSKDDARALEITVTSKGKMAIKQVKNLFVEQEKKLLSGMEKEEIEIFRFLLKRACENIGIEV